MDNLEYIDAYFNGEISPEEKRKFEQRVTGEPSFAEEVAFYLSSKQVANQEALEERERFRDVYTSYKQGNHYTGRQPATIIQRLWPWVAAAAVLVGIIFGWYAWLRPVDSKSLADKYIVEHFQTLPVTMSSNRDSLQTGLRLYNEGRLEEALKKFEDLVHRDTSLTEAKKYAGIVSLRLGQYDKAIDYFSELEKYTQLYANPGKFYHALTLLERNLPGDKPAAKLLLEQVVQNDLEAKATAQEWLKKM